MDKIQIHNIDFNKFIEALDTCKGDVFLETSEGDSLNLRSQLCQIMGIANILDGAKVSESTIRCTNPEDESKLFRFNLYGKLDKEQDVL